MLDGLISTTRDETTRDKSISILSAMVGALLLSQVTVPGHPQRDRAGPSRLRQRMDRFILLDLAAAEEAISQHATSLRYASPRSRPAERSLRCSDEFLLAAMAQNPQPSKPMIKRFSCFQSVLWASRLAEVFRT